MQNRKRESKQQAMQQPQERMQPPGRLRWTFDRGVPTQDFLAEHELTRPGELDEVVEKFIFYLKEGRFELWESVVAREQGLGLTQRQRRALEALLDFSDGEEERVLYIDEMPRPSEPWHVILNRIAPHLLIRPFLTAEPHYEGQLEGWRQITLALAEHGGGLCLPEGVERPAESVPEELRHQLELQDCIQGALSGLGQERELTLANPDHLYRVADFVAALQRCRPSVAYLRLDLASLMERVLLPDCDRPVFLAEVQKRLGLRSLAEPIAPTLGPPLQLHDSATR